MENIDVPQRFIEKNTKEGKKQNSKKTVTQQLTSLQ